MKYIKPRTVIASGSNKLIVTRDDREKKPWLFINKLTEVKVKRLKVGDYSIEGYEDMIAIEKKSGFAELFGDLSGAYRPTFVRFLTKLSKVPIKIMVIEEPFTSANIEKCLRVLRKKSHGRIKLNEETIYHWTTAIQIRYNISMWFLDKRAATIIVPKILNEAYIAALNLQEVRA